MDKISILVLGLRGAEDMSRSVQSILELSRDLAVIGEKLPDSQAPDYSAVLVSIFDRSRPDIVLVCAPRDASAQNEAVFELARRNKWEPPIVLVLEAAEPEELHRLLALGAADFILAPLRQAELLPRLLRLHRVVSEGDQVTLQLKE